MLESKKKMEHSYRTMTVLIPLPSSPGDINLAPKKIYKNVRSDYLNAMTMVIIHDVLYDIIPSSD